MPLTDTLSTEYSNIPDNSLVCLRFYKDEEWVLITRWSRKLTEQYTFCHSNPYTPKKGNIEPIFPHAVYEKIPIEEQTIENLRTVYNKKDKQKNFRTKIFEHNLFCTL